MQIRFPFSLETDEGLNRPVSKTVKIYANHRYDFYRPVVHKIMVSRAALLKVTAHPD